MPYTSITFTSTQVPGASTAANLSWLSGRPTTVQVSNGSTSMTSDFTLAMTLNDIQRTQSSAVIWTAYSSAVGSSALHFASSLINDPGGLFISLLTPFAALRLASTAMSSSYLTLGVINAELR